MIEVNFKNYQPKKSCGWIEPDGQIWAIPPSVGDKVMIGFITYKVTDRTWVSNDRIHVMVT